MEFIGTFFLLLTIGLTVNGGADNIILKTIDVAFIIMIYAGDQSLRQHYNPAETLAVLIRGRIIAVEVVPYIIVR